MMRMFGRHKDIIDNVLKEISVQFRDKVIFLDIGCAIGERTVLFEADYRVLHAVDRKASLSESAKKRILFRQTDLMEESLPYQDESFDFIFSFDVIEHLPKPEFLLREARRLLKKNGIFVISTPNRNRLFGFILIWLGVRKFPNGSLNKESIPIELYAPHLREYTDKELEMFLKKEGFRIVKTHRIFYGVTGLYGFKKFFDWPFFHNIIIECTK